MPDYPPEVCRAVKLAYRGFTKLTEAEQKDVLTALVHTCNGADGAAANDALYYKRKYEHAQLTLTAIMEGVGKTP